MISWFAKKPKAEIRLHNTATRTVEEFVPLHAGQVKMYNCGPTVYNYATIGNLRAYVVWDIVRRMFEYAGYKVTQVMNLTDFGHLVSDGDEGEDKMTVGLTREGLELTMENMYVLASKYVIAFKDDLSALNIKTPHAMPRASEHVKGMIAYIEQLINKGFAYKISDGIYFDTKKFPQYGVLGGSASVDHSRIGINTEKHDPRDFTLWKFDEKLGWDSPWGKGFPGWHIECTAMSTQYLGKSFDVHTGGIDHIAIHHNNEIAQAEAANNKPYARYWLHNEFITIDNARIGKSQGNQILLHQLLDRGVSPLAYRYWLLTGHYRQSMNFTWDAVEGAQTGLFRALKQFADLRGSGSVNAEYQKKFADALYNDLDTPRAIAVMWELLKDPMVAGGDKRATILDFDRVLGVGFSMTDSERRTVLGTITTDTLPADIQALVAARAEARTKKDFGASDRIRNELIAKGYTVDDTAEGQQVRKGMV